MSGSKSATSWLGLALLLLLCSAPLSALDYDGPDLPQGWRPISTIELTELETILSRQDETIARQQTTLTTLSETIARQQTTISGLETSFDEYVSEAQTTITSLQAEVWVYRGVVAVITALALYLAIR